MANIHPQNLASFDHALGSPDENTRWQAAIALGTYCETVPEAIWPLTVKWGSSDDEDVRAAIGTCVLEHILEHHFEPYFAKTEEIIWGGNKNFALTFRTCWRFGNAEIVDNAARWDELDGFIAAMEAAE